MLGVHCLRRRTRSKYPLCQAHAASHTPSNLLSLGLENRRDPSHLSPSSSVVLSRTPSSSPVGGLGVSAGAKAAGVCSKNLLRTCCCAGDYPARTQPPACHSLPIIKIHQLSLCENGEAVWATESKHCFRKTHSLRVWLNPLSWSVQPWQIMELI